jgi:asparagine synthase (glutamine-hydrolysing)
MFALAGVGGDAGSGFTVRLSRDYFGIKPLYYRRISDGYAFASEISPLAQIEGERLDGQDGAVAEFMAFGRVLGDTTFYRQIRSVPPGATVELGESGALIGPGPQAGGGARTTDLRAAIRASVEGCLISDRPLGLALSGGLDSSIIAYELNALGVEDLATVSVRMRGVADGLDDLRQLGLPPGGAWNTWRHHLTVFEPADLPPLIEDAVGAGQPTRMTSFPLYLALARAAKEAGVVVLLTGEGADELFSGYESYLSWWGGLRQQPTFERLYEFALPAKRRAWLAGLLGPEAVAWCRARLQESCAEVADLEPFRALRRLELALSLEPLLLRTDYCLMRYGIEGRTPFLHGDVPALADALGPRELCGRGQTKLALRAAYRDELPPAIRSGAKRAFRAPAADWFAGSLAPWVSQRLRGHAAELAELGLNPAGVEELLCATLGRDEEAAALCFALLTLLSWKGKGGRLDRVRAA